MSTTTHTPGIPEENRDGEPGYWPAADFAAKRAAAIMAPRGTNRREQQDLREAEQTFWQALSERLSVLLDTLAAEPRSHVAIHLDHGSPLLREVPTAYSLGLHAWPTNLQLLVWGHKVVERVITEDGQTQATVVYGAPEYGTDAEFPIRPGRARQFTVAFGDEMHTYTVHHDPNRVLHPWRIDSPADTIAHGRGFHNERKANDAARAHVAWRRASIISAHTVLHDAPLTLDEACSCVTVTENMITWEVSTGE